MTAPASLLDEYSDNLRRHIELAQQVIQELSLTLSGPPEIRPGYDPDGDAAGDSSLRDRTHDGADGKILFFNVRANVASLAAANVALAEKELKHQLVKDGQFTIVFTADQNGYTC